MNRNKHRDYIPACGHYDGDPVKIAKKGRLYGKRAVFYEIVCKECSMKIPGKLNNRQEELDYLLNN